MDFEETMVDENLDEQTDDTFEQEIVEEEPDESESLDSITGDEEEAPAEEPEPQPQATEPGWIKKRVE